MLELREVPVGSGEEAKKIFVDSAGNLVDSPNLEGDKFKVVEKFTPEPAKPDVDDRGVPLTNVVAELTRKLEKAIKENVTPPKPKVDRVKEYRKKLVAADKFTAEEIDDKVEILQVSVDSANDNMSEQLKGIEKPLRTATETNNLNQRSKLLKEFQDTPEKFELDAGYGKLIGKHVKAIQKELETITLDYEVTPRTLKAVIGTVFLDNKVYLGKSGGLKELGDNEHIVEPSGPALPKLPDGINKDEFKEFVGIRGLDISTAEKRNTALSAFKKKKEYDKLSEPK